MLAGTGRVLGAGASSPPLATAQAGAVLFACQYLSPNEVPGSEGSEGDDPRLLVSLPVFNKKSLFLPVEPIARKGPSLDGMNRRDFSPGGKGTEEPMLALEQTFHSSPQLDVIPSLCFFFAAAL